jgi:hypothetical protein
VSVCMDTIVNFGVIYEVYSPYCYQGELPYSEYESYCSHTQLEEPGVSNLRGTS